MVLTMSKPIQIAVNQQMLFALCDDGSIWGLGLQYDTGWKRAKDIPSIPIDTETRVADASIWRLPAEFMPKPMPIAPALPDLDQPSAPVPNLLPPTPADAPAPADAAPAPASPDPNAVL